MALAQAGTQRTTKFCPRPSVGLTNDTSQSVKYTLRIHPIGPERFPLVMVARPDAPFRDFKAFWNMQGPPRELDTHRRASGRFPLGMELLPRETARPSSTW